MDFHEIRALSSRIKENISKVIVGKEGIIDLLLVALIGNGHVLLEDVPGTGKTMIAKSLAISTGCEFRRIQFTPDLLPSDVTGMNIYNQKKSDFEFRPGPVFANVILADEINRATPRTQSSLLECMEERQVTIDGETRQLESPFFVIATQNPVEIQGTFPLPEAQLDRFFLKLKMGYPSTEEALGILDRFIDQNPLEHLEPVASAREIAEAQESYQKVHVSQAIREYIIAIIEKTRERDQVILGVSPRGSLALMRAAQVYALIKGRDYVLPDDIKALVQPVLGHRMIVKNTYGVKGNQTEAILEDILQSVPVPTEELSFTQDI
ncbi:MAG: AAA family ATPase [Clostridia bacterium]|jgi:MoxR-like ATPase